MELIYPELIWGRGGFYKSDLIIMFLALAVTLTLAIGVLLLAYTTKESGRGHTKPTQPGVRQGRRRPRSDDRSGTAARRD